MQPPQQTTKALPHIHPRTPTKRQVFSGYSPEEVLRSVRALVELGEAASLIQLLESYLSQYALTAAEHIHTTMQRMHQPQLLHGRQSPRDEEQTASIPRRRGRAGGGEGARYAHAVCDAAVHPPHLFARDDHDDCNEENTTEEEGEHSTITRHAVGGDGDGMTLPKAPLNTASVAAASSTEVGLYAFRALATLWHTFDAHIREVMTVWVYLQQLSHVGATVSLDALAIQCMNDALDKHAAIMEAALEGYQETLRADLRRYGTLRDVSVLDRSWPGTTGAREEVTHNPPLGSDGAMGVTDARVATEECSTSNACTCNSRNDHHEHHPLHTKDEARMHEAGSLGASAMSSDNPHYPHNNNNNMVARVHAGSDEGELGSGVVCLDTGERDRDGVRDRCLLRSFLSLTMAIQQYFSRVQPLVLAMVSQHYTRCADAALARASRHTLHGAHYFALAAVAMGEERDRVRAYLHPHTLPPLEEIAQRVLIEYAGRRILESEMAAMMEQREYAGLAQAWKLIARGSYVQDDGFVTRLFRSYVEETGRRCMNQLLSPPASASHPIVTDAESAATGSRSRNDFGVVKAIIHLVDMGEETIRRSFGEDQRVFTVQLYEAVESTLHMHVQCFSEQLALYLHTTMMDVCKGVLPLRRRAATSAAGESVCAEDVLHGIGTVFAHHPQKHVFESLYWSQLAHRLLRGPRQSTHEEEWCFVRILAHACGSTFAAKYESMLKDMNSSAKLDEMYISWSKKQQERVQRQQQHDQQEQQEVEEENTKEVDEEQHTATSSRDTGRAVFLSSSSSSSSPFQYAHAAVTAPHHSESVCEEDEQQQQRAQASSLHAGDGMNAAWGESRCGAPRLRARAGRYRCHTRSCAHTAPTLRSEWAALAILHPGRTHATPRWAQLADYVQLFCRESFPKCRLTWHHELSTAVLRVRRAGGPAAPASSSVCARAEEACYYYDMSGTVIQAAVLLLLDAALHTQAEQAAAGAGHGSRSEDAHRVGGTTTPLGSLTVGELCRRLQLDPTAAEVVDSIAGLTQEPCRVLQLLPAARTSASAGTAAPPSCARVDSSLPVPSSLSLLAGVGRLHCMRRIDSCFVTILHPKRHTFGFVCCRVRAAERRTRRTPRWTRRRARAVRTRWTIRRRRHAIRCWRLRSFRT